MVLNISTLKRKKIKTTIKTTLDSLKRDVWDDSFIKTKHPEVNLKKTKPV